MPATRSRSTNWLDALRQIHSRRGAVDITPPSNTTDDGASVAPALVARAHIIAVDEKQLILERPSALGRALSIEEGSDIVAVIHIGQNRWSFNSTILEVLPPTSNAHAGALRLKPPEALNRCPRRSFYRVPAHNLDLPAVNTFPILDPHSAPVAQAVARQRAINPADPTDNDTASEADFARPTVGPPFESTLLDVGGGGVGLLVKPEDRATLSKHPLFWLEICLGDLLPAPLCVAAKLRHTNPDALQNVEAGFSFHFGNDPAHEAFVSEQISAYLRALQRLNANKPQPQSQPPSQPGPKPAANEEPRRAA